MNLNFSKDFKIEDLGECELDVYDIETEDNHNFVANNIVVHNSTYFDMSPVIKNI